MNKALKTLSNNLSGLNLRSNFIARVLTSKRINSNFLRFYTSKISVRQFSQKETQPEDVDQDSTDPDFKKKSKVKITNENVLSMIDDWVQNNNVVLFMKGTREMPRCGFSNYLVQIMNHYDIKDVKVVNILEDPILREAVKSYSNWPTYPQLYVKGSLIGIIYI